ncbi:MAG: HAD-IIIC family phosphatase [Paludibaculum sp.]
MKLSQALALVQQRRDIGSRRKIFLACGFQPLHLVTFLQGHFAQRFEQDAADIQVGAYGDLAGTLAAAAESQAEAGAVIIEWSDLDPRLGCRSSGGWGPSVEHEIVANCRERVAQLLSRLEHLASTIPLALALPSLPVPLFGHTNGGQLGLAEAELEELGAALAVAAARLANVRIVRSSRLDRLSPPGGRFDANMELAAGFPYGLAHASTLAQQLIGLLYPSNPMKGLITDLDNTLWAGIVGEVGASAVGWGLAEHAQLHGLYQQQLKQFSEMGVLLAVSSKNDAAVAESALSRPDLYVPASAFFPVIANWQPKSMAVAEILKAWNIGAESVTYVDDSPMELEEVKTAFPLMTCLRFPNSSPAKGLELLEQLRDLFGKPALASEDALRHESIRANMRFRETAAQTSPNEFLAQLRSKLTFDIQKDPSNKRLLELINKTNQFNLNGTRISEGEWLRFLTNPLSFVIGVSYEDKFGPLGVIAVIAGRRSDNQLDVSTWVMSCRAFSRNIELHILKYLFASTNFETIRFAFRATERNTPMQTFINTQCPAQGSSDECTIVRTDFLRRHNELPDMVVVAGEHALVGLADDRVGGE